MPLSSLPRTVHCALHGAREASAGGGKEGGGWTPEESLNLLRDDGGRMHAAPHDQQAAEHKHRPAPRNLAQPPVNTQLLHMKAASRKMCPQLLVERVGVFSSTSTPCDPSSLIKHEEENQNVKCGEQGVGRRSASLRAPQAPASPKRWDDRRAAPRRSCPCPPRPSAAARPPAEAPAPPWAPPSPRPRAPGTPGAAPPTAGTASGRPC